LIASVQRDSRAAARAFSQPYAVAPLVSGGVQVEWRGSGGSIEVEIGPHGELGFFLERPAGTEPPTSEGDDVSRAKILRLVQSVLVPATRQQW
jgi:hypothetical protein